MDIKEENEVKKNYLWGYQRAKRHAERIDEELIELRMNKITPSLIQDGMPHGSGSGDLSSYASRIDELERKLVKARYEKIQKFKEIRDCIEQLPDENEKDLLIYRYIRNMKWEEIAVKMHYSWQWLHKVHARALMNIKIKQAIESDKKRW